MTTTPNTAVAALAWARRQLGATSSRITRWNSQAPGEWCGVWLAAAMRAVGIKPPAGYQAAHSWSTFGTAVKPGEEQLGDVLVYGYNHVALYAGNKEQIQGNNQNGTVGSSGIGSNLGLGPITAIRRPPYKSAGGGESTIGEVGNFLGNVVGGTPLSGILGNTGTSEAKKGAEAAGSAASSLAGEVLSDLEGTLGEKAVPLALNIGLIGGGAFLAYFGLARMVGVDHPVQAPLHAVKGAGEAAAAGAA